MSEQYDPYDEIPRADWRYKLGVEEERERILARLIELDAIRRDALGYLVAFNTHGTEVIYLSGIEGDTE